MTTVPSTAIRPGQASILLGAMAVALTAITAVAPDLHWRVGGWLLIGVFAAGGLAAFLAMRLAGRADGNALLIILAGAVAMRVVLLLAEPSLSSDVYRYIWDGRVQAAGINPYRYVPAAPELASLRDADIWPYINRADYAVTIYPPLAQAMFLVLTRLGESVLVMKLGLLLLEAIGVAAIIAMLRRLRLPATHVAAYVWHPLPVWEIAGNGHVDAAMLALLLLGLLTFLAGRSRTAGVLIALGGLVKPVALVVLPVIWRPWNWQLPLIVVATILLAYVPYLSVGAGVLGFLPGYLQEEGFTSGSGYKLLWLLQSLSGPLAYGAPVYMALSAAGLMIVAVVVGFRRNRSATASLRAARWLLTMLLVLFSPNYPWYFLALVPFLALAPSAAGWVLTTGSVLFYDIVPGDILPAYEVRITVFTLAALAAVAFDAWNERRGSPARAEGSA